MKKIYNNNNKNQGKKNQLVFSKDKASEKKKKKLECYILTIYRNLIKIPTTPRK